jgi:hypothetical protein
LPRGFREGGFTIYFYKLCFRPCWATGKYASLVVVILPPEDKRELLWVDGKAAQGYGFSYHDKRCCHTLTSVNKEPSYSLHYKINSRQT